ncbi:tRNA epoxyqueuosine(34) reductase QueG [Paraburkholderia rhizosphaerae]|uniref:Epoxyqueuosine reductase n=1 Tax=Paraburkholderia rhizosphaerae TaxID=480658 RepID=A0A4V3HFI3_9BURK|nr:tRNA epoxyqueuosine(34) reductase QueG [Paraburkholderia rhizosphaerae]TDY53225.1 epoxyqueuosine reductase [Paraburkholderia rhizosphaerae]
MDRSQQHPVSGTPDSNGGPRAHPTLPYRFDDAALAALASRIRTWGRELGFGEVGISDTDLASAEAGLAAWLDAGWHGEMDYMAKHGMKRARPAELVAGTLRVITARMAYLPASTEAGKGGESGVESAAAREPGDGVRGKLVADSPAQQDWRRDEHARLADPSAAVVSIYARGRDYHKVMRNRLQQLAERIEHEVGGYGFRVFTDSAPVLEVELAQKAGVGWRGKHTLLLQRDAGSLFFLGEIYVDLPLPTDAQRTPERAPQTAGAHCGHCTRCIDACPTGAIVGPYKVDARRCISYLTIELKGSIPQDLRPLIGNRVYGCDDCQLACPWNKFAQAAPVADFDVRHGLDRASLTDLFGWSAADFDARMQGSAIRRIGYECWLRNLAVGMGNALRADPASLAPHVREAIVDALRQRADDASPLVREHVQWALEAA